MALRGITQRPNLGAVGVGTRIAVGADPYANCERRPGRCGESYESDSKSGSKKPGTKDYDRNERRISQSFRSFRILDGFGYDIDADGAEEDNQFLFDKQRGMLYTYRNDNYQCTDGKSEIGDVLMGIYAKGNAAGKPVGSGWFVVAVKPGQCGEKRAGIFGCRFDATGKPTTCGTARVKEESGELEVAVKN